MTETTSAPEAEPDTDYEPKIVAYCCTYCAYTAADLAGSMRLDYPSTVRVVKITCTGRIEPFLLLKALEQGADAVMVCGCNIGDCHFLEGNLRAKQWVRYTKKLLAECGMQPERLEFFHVPASAATHFAEVVTQMTETAKRLGPNPLRKAKDQARAAGANEGDPS